MKVYPLKMGKVVRERRGELEACPGGYVVRRPFMLDWRAKEASKVVHVYVRRGFQCDGASYAPDEESCAWLYHDYIYRHRTHLNLTRVEADEILYDVMRHHHGEGWLALGVRCVYWAVVRSCGFLFWNNIS